jgi:hypothetical protein
MTMTANRLSFGSWSSIVRTGLGLVLAFVVAGSVGCGSKGSGGTTGAGGSGACPMGSEGCACYGNDTCNAPLSCLSHICVNATGNGGATGSGGSPATGGSPGSGGSPATGGTTGSGGSVSTGGTTGSGGSSSSGGATGTGGSSSSGGASGSGGSSSSGGTTGSGGSSSTGGTTGSGGSSSTGGAGGAPTGPLQFTAGWVDGTSNAYGIQGALYTFDDGAGSAITPDCSTGAACFGGTTTPTTKFCVSGSDATVGLNSAGTDYDYTTYWGAAVGFDLNGSTTAGATHQPYVASAHNVVGFSMTLTNNTSAAVRFSYIVYNGSSNTAYCVSQLTPGTNTVYFNNATSNCYTTGGTVLSKTAADGTVALQWQVPSSQFGAVPFNYCIDNLTPLTQ